MCETAISSPAGFRGSIRRSKSWSSIKQARMPQKSASRSNSLTITTRSLTSDITGAARLHRAAYLLMDGLGPAERSIGDGASKADKEADYHYPTDLLIKLMSPYALTKNERNKREVTGA